MRKAVFVVLMFLFATFPFFALAETFVIKIGEDLRLPIPPNHRVWVQNRKLLNISTQGGFVILNGKSEGQTSLQLGNKTHQVQVIQPLKKNLLQNFEKELKTIIGLRMGIKKYQVTVSGKLYRWEDWQKLAKISEETGISYAMNAEIPRGLQDKVLSHWQQEFALAGLAPLPVHFARPIQARSAVAPQYFAKYEDILAPYGVLLEKDTEALDLAPVVKVQITVAEVRRDFTQKYGLQWPESYNAKVLGDGHTEFESVVFGAHALEKQGSGKILASPNLICRSGKEAEFLAGGEFPIKLLNYKMQDVVWKRYGILLKVRPKADSSGRMSIGIETEISTIDQSRTVDGIPGMFTNRVSSHFDLSHSQTIVLSGLLKNENGNSTEGLPGLSRIPILGALFGSRDFKENRTELIILVRPSIMGEETPNGHLGDLKND